MDEPMDWGELTRLTGDEPFAVERIRIARTGIAVEGRFAPPPLAGLDESDQVFVAAFVQAHGSIKRMEQLFGVSYPTIKNRLNRIAGQLPQTDVSVGPLPAENASDVLERLEQGQISVEQALGELREQKENRDV